MSRVIIILFSVLRFGLSFPELLFHLCLICELCVGAGNNKTAPVISLLLYYRQS
ncbi:hypothetical protein B194_2825 [Serratia plymuthica A30]|nr:hypothetical protein B194_2825 [Serratia plymuthica A30]